MLDSYLLEELATFAQEGSFAATARKLKITQPSVTRGMQKLEDEIGVPLFNRQINQVTLTPAGKIAAQKAAQIVQLNQDLLTSVQKYAANHGKIMVASNAPGPIILMKELIRKTDSHFKIADEPVDIDQIPELLRNRKYKLIISNQEIQTDDIESYFIGYEKLNVRLDKFTYLANSTSLQFKQLANMNFIVFDDIGPWKEVIQDHIDNAHFLYQAQRLAMTEIAKYSNFPYFSTNITEQYPKGLLDENDDRITIPISDDAAKMDFYVSYLTENRREAQAAIKEISQTWPK